MSLPASAVLFWRVLSGWCWWRRVTLLLEAGNRAGLNEFERQHYRGHRWWSHAELAATRETIYPAGLAALVAGLIAGRLPASPIALPWHH
jgi:hypothetical protein